MGLPVGYKSYIVKKKIAFFPSPAGMFKLFPPSKSMISDIPAGEEKIANLFLQCMTCILLYYPVTTNCSCNDDAIISCNKLGIKSSS
jgi:hypothetical protein